MYLMDNILFCKEYQYFRIEFCRYFSKTEKMYVDMTFWVSSWKLFIYLLHV